MLQISHRAVTSEAALHIKAAILTAIRVHLTLILVHACACLLIKMVTHSARAAVPTRAVLAYPRRTADTRSYHAFVDIYKITAMLFFFSPTAMLAFVNGPKGNSLTLGKFESYLRSVICKLILVVDDWGIRCEIVLGLMSLNLTDDKPTSVQVMAWCLQTTSHHCDNVNPVQYRHMASLGRNWVNTKSSQSVWWRHQMVFRVTAPLCGEFTSHWWIPLTKARDAELWCFLWSAPEQTHE